MPTSSLLRYIIRPNHINWTPKNLAKKLEIETRRWPRNTNWGQFDFDKDFFMTYPHGSTVKTEEPTVYSMLRSFWGAGKLGQRAYLNSKNIPTPATWGINWNADLPSIPNKIICRPPTHQDGSDYRIVSNIEEIQMGEYASKAFPKDSEFRIVYVLGEPLITIEKYLSTLETIEPDVAQIMPWNEANKCMWRTIRNDSNLLSHTDIHSRLAVLPIIQHSHIIGVDIMCAGHTWVITEFNACPTLKVSNHLEQVSNYVQANK